MTQPVKASLAEADPLRRGRPHPLDLEGRRNEAKTIREFTKQDADDSASRKLPVDNKDELRFDLLRMPGFASFTKALAHDGNGLVEPRSFASLLAALGKGTQEALEKVQLGGGVRRLVNPLNSYSYQLIGDDSNGARMAPAPTFASRSTAVDMVERYWMALARDVPFSDYAKSPLIADACADLNNVGFEQEFGFYITPETIFRAPYRGSADGPHVSQFLLQDFKFGNQRIDQVQCFPRENLDFMTDFETWTKVNDGTDDPTGDDELEIKRRIVTLRDAGQWVHIDFPHQSGLWCTLQLLQLGEGYTPLTLASPYANGDIMSSDPFGSLGGPDVTVQAALAGVYGLKHAWFQKWCVHRRLRPEVYAQRLELFRRGLLGSSPDDPFNDKLFNQLFGEGADVWRTTKVLPRILEHNALQNKREGRGDKDGTWLLPMGFPEGSPTHPSYPGGHSAFVAAAVTIAKAFFEDVPFPNPVVPSSDGKGLDCINTPLTVHGELNKLIGNVTLFRDGAGMHWRTDGTSSGPKNEIETGGNLLGERLAISMLRDVKRTYREKLGVFKFKGLNGDEIEI